MKCHREFELLEYLLESLEYDIVISKEGVHYSGQEQKDIIEADGVEERLADSLENTLENSLESSLENSLKRLNHHTHVLIEEETSEQHTEMFPKEEEAWRPYVFNFNNCFVSVGFVVDAGENLSQMSIQVKVEDKDYVEVFNPWNKDIMLLERMLENQDFMQKEIIMKEGKDERAVARIRKLQREDNEHQIEDGWTKYNKKWQSMYQPKDMFEIEIEELWQLMMKQSIWRRLIATGRVISQNLNLIDKERKMKQKIADIQQQQRCRAFRQLQTKVWDPGGFLSTYENTLLGDHECFQP